MNDEEDDRDEMREQADIIHNTFIQVQEERAENKKKIVLCCIVGFAITFYISYVVPN
jgi:type IV secretory pathway VirD2 relaxase